jgi:hypothetical protein
MVLGLIKQAFTGKKESLFYHPSVHVRFLIAAPLLLLADHVFPWICNRSLDQLVAQGFIPEASRSRFEKLYHQAQRLADAAWPELVLALASLAVGIAAIVGLLPLSGRDGRTWPTPAQFWYALAAAPLLHFLFWRSLWRWSIWVRIVVGLSRMPLRLIATHPDRCGGIRFLRLPSTGYCAMLLFVASSLLCAEWSGHALEPTLKHVLPLVLLFVVVGAAIAFGPLFLFLPRLVRARLDGVLEYDGVSSEQGRRFRRVWIVDRQPNLLAAPDAQTLDSIGNIYSNWVARIRFVLFDKNDVVFLLVATLLPVLPIMLVHMPVESWRALVEALTGNPLF